MIVPCCTCNVGHAYMLMPLDVQWLYWCMESLARPCVRLTFKAVQCIAVAVGLAESKGPLLAPEVKCAISVVLVKTGILKHKVFGRNRVERKWFLYPDERAWLLSWYVRDALRGTMATRRMSLGPANTTLCLPRQQCLQVWCRIHLSSILGRCQHLEQGHMAMQGYQMC
jgi:hypothetical protein